MSVGHVCPKATTMTFLFIHQFFFLPTILSHKMNKIRCKMEKYLWHFGNLILKELRFKRERAEISNGCLWENHRTQWQPCSQWDCIWIDSIKRKRFNKSQKRCTSQTVCIQITFHLMSCQLLGGDSDWNTTEFAFNSYCWIMKKFVFIALSREFWFHKFEYSFCFNIKNGYI